MRTKVVFLGGDARDPLQVAAVDYLARCGRRYDAGLVELKPSKRGKGADDDAVRSQEADQLLMASEGHTRVALDPLGTVASSSEAFAAGVEQLMMRGKPLAFLIGGATGHHQKLLDAADARWSLSPLTFAHRMALVVLAEQLYRASEIARGGPYHK
jgi:23S rRNA (pseudouridine1915-N3)-methyltransferase